MGSEELLTLALALPPVWLSVSLWWSTRHAVDELRESSAFASSVAQRDDGHALDPRTLNAAKPSPEPSAGGW